MPDMEKVINEAFDEAITEGVNRLSFYCTGVCNDDDHFDIGYNNGLEEGRRIALALLKERVKTKVVFGRTKDGKFVTECGKCGTYLDKAYSHCPKCKKELDWNSCQS